MPLRLEVFDTVLAFDGTPQPLVAAAAVEEAKVAGFEQGYAAGWDDAAAAQRDEQTRLRADLARNLQTLAFTFQDARNHVLQAIRPLIMEMTGRLLPAIAQETLAPMVVEALSPIAERLSDAPLALVLNPAARPQVEDLVTRETSLPITIIEEPSLSEGQVYLRFGATEAKVDLDQVTEDIARAVRAFFSLNP